MLKVTYHVEGKTAKDLADGLRAHLAILSTENASEIPPAPKRGRPPKAKNEKDDPEMDLTSDDREIESGDGHDLDTSDDEEDTEILSDSDENESETDSDADTDEDDDNDEEEKKAPVKTKARETKPAAPTLDTLMDQFQKHMKAHGRDSALRILKKLKVTSIRALSEKQYPQALALLK